MENAEYYLIIIGVSGSGKTSIGKMLAQQLDVEFIEGDDLHSQANIDKMNNSIALNDEDRLPWLNIIKEKISNKIKEQKSFVLSCSALKVSYRDVLREAGNVKFLFLKVDEKEIAERLKFREGHFMPSSLLYSQLQTLEAPNSKEKDILTIDASKSPEDIIKQLKTVFNIPKK
jgi:carbohydrate kinase (thermoresistant glucokinase family)